MKSVISVIILTYKRAYILKYVLEGLKKQTYENFEVIVVLKPGGDETKEILEEYSKDIPLTIVIQNSGFVTDAYNLGLAEANGEIIAFLDDDAVPHPNWLEEHVNTYNKYNGVGGVSGITTSAKITENGELKQIPEDSVYPYGRKTKYYDFPWSRPLTGMSGLLIYFGRDGLVHHHPRLEDENLHGIFPSLLHMGANMSVKKEAIERINENSLMGFAFEQLLSYQIWHRGYKLLYNTSAKVLHLVHKESTGRFFQSPSRAALRDAEYVLTFFNLKSEEKEVFWVAYFLGFVMLVISRLLRGRDYGFSISMHRIYGLLCGFVTGCTFVISHALGGNFSIRNSLHKFLKDS